LRWRSGWAKRSAAGKKALTTKDTKVQKGIPS
jgi:hypothetical protein